MTHNLNVFAKNKILVLISILVAFFTINTKAQYTTGNIAVVSAASASANNTTASILELNPAINNSTPVTTLPILGTGTDAIRISGSASSTCYLTNNSDGSQLALCGHYSINSTANVNTLLTRAVVSVSYNGTYSIITNYTGTSGNQTRCATTLNNTTWYIADQGGIYSNNSLAASPTGNYRSIKSFGGIVYVEIQSSNITTVQVNTVSAPVGGTITGLPGLTNNANIQDFYLVSSGNNGTAYDILYTLSNTSATSGTVTKYSLVSGSWVSNGSYTTSFGGFGLLAKYIASNGGTTLYITSGTGAVAGNSVVRVTDGTGYNAPISITTSSNTVIYTAASGTVLKGIAWAPIYVPPPAVTLTVAPTAVNAFTTAMNSISSIDSFSVSGTNLTGNISITAPNYFEVSDNVNGPFASTVTFTPTSGVVNRMVYVLFHPLNYGTVNGSIQIATNGAPAQNVAVSGTAPSPTITVSSTQITNTFSCNQGGVSSIDSFLVTGSLLGTNVSVTAPNNFQISFNANSGYSSNLSIAPINGIITGTTVYVRYAPSGYNVTNDTIKLTATSAATKIVKVSGYTINSTNPVAFNLATGIYDMSQWDSLSLAGTFPPNMIFHTTNNSNPLLVYNQLVNNWNCGYNLNARSRIKGLGGDGISFINTGSPQYDNCSSGTAINNSFMGAALLALNTSNSSNITMSFKLGMVTQGNGVIQRVCNIRLQYRLDSISTFNDYNPITEYTSLGKLNGDFQSYSFMLPSLFENQSYVQFRWLYYLDTTVAGSGTRPELRVDDIHIYSCNSYATPVTNISSSATNICDSTQVTFTTSSTGAGQSPIYQWYLNGTQISGATDNNYSSNTFINGDVISVMMNTSETCYTQLTDTSNSITLTVNPIINPAVSILSIQSTVCPGANVTFNSNLINGGTNST
jgi:hypothetical protein